MEYQLGCVRCFGLKKKGEIEITVYLFNKIRNKSDFPEEWKIAIICPIYKGRGKRDDASNY
jgi:hypothetical protein